MVSLIFITFEGPSATSYATGLPGFGAMGLILHGSLQVKFLPWLVPTVQSLSSTHSRARSHIGCLHAYHQARVRLRRVLALSLIRRQGGLGRQSLAAQISPTKLQQ